VRSGRAASPPEPRKNDPRSGGRAQPTAQAVGRHCAHQPSPEGAKETLASTPDGSSRWDRLGSGRLPSNFSYAPPGLLRALCAATHGLRRGLHSFAASRLGVANNRGGQSCRASANSWPRNLIVEACFFRPSGLVCQLCARSGPCPPTACAVGCVLSLLRSWGFARAVAAIPDLKCDQLVCDVDHRI
jgi:hypothetical protein